MTKRELIERLNALDVPDNAEVVILHNKDDEYLEPISLEHETYDTPTELRVPYIEILATLHKEF